LTSENQAPEQLVRLLFADLDAVVEALPQDQQDAFREARDSVVDARRAAEVNEGLLRIN
jgi:hypothetical protein